MNFFPLSVFKYFVLSMLFFPAFCHAQMIHVGVFQDHFNVINSYAKEGKCPTQLPVKHQDNQMLAEYLILCNALNASGQHFKVKLVPFPVAERALQAIEQKKIHVTAFGIWHKQITNYNAKASLRLLDNNEFTKGLFTSEKKLKEIDFTNHKSKHDYIISVNKNWQHDWQELSCSGLTLKHIDQYEQMFQLIELGRIDLVPLTFNSRPDMQRSAFGIPLYPVEGVKFTINDSLHFAVNNRTPLGKQLSTALDIGLSALNKTAYISNVYEKLGITNKNTTQWNNVGCQDVRVAKH